MLLLIEVLILVKSVSLKKVQTSKVMLVLLLLVKLSLWFLLLLEVNKDVVKLVVSLVLPIPHKLLDGMFYSPELWLEKLKYLLIHQLYLLWLVLLKLLFLLDQLLIVLKEECLIHL